MKYWDSFFCVRAISSYVSTSIRQYFLTLVHQNTHASDPSYFHTFIRSFIRISVCSGIHLNELPLCWPYESTSVSLLSFILIFPDGRPFSHKDGFPYILPSKWMTGCLTFRNCKHNDGHSEKDLPHSESADDYRLIADDFHPGWTPSHYSFLLSDNPDAIYRNAYYCRMFRLTAIQKQYHSSSIPCFSYFDFSCKHVNISGITRFGKVCFELHEIDFAAQNPCRILVGLTPKS